MQLDLTFSRWARSCSTMFFCRDPRPSFLLQHSAYSMPISLHCGTTKFDLFLSENLLKWRTAQSKQEVMHRKESTHTHMEWKRRNRLSEWNVPLEPNVLFLHSFLAMRPHFNCAPDQYKHGKQRKMRALNSDKYFMHIFMYAFAECGAELETPTCVPFILHKYPSGPSYRCWRH